MAGEGVNFNEFELSLTINAGRAEAGTAAIVRALKAIEAASTRAAKVTEEQLAKRATDAQIRAAEKALRAQEKAARQATLATEKAARDRARADEKAARAASAAAKRTEREVIASARTVARENAAAAREVERIVARTYREQARAAKQAAAEAKRASQEQKKSLRGVADEALNLRNIMLGIFVGQAARGIVGTIASYEQLKNSLITVEGAQHKANETFSKLQAFANETPFTLEQATKAWIRMRGAGLEPTIDKLRAFGDIASIQSGKTVLDFVEAVGDAVMGEQERLKEFGIKMEQQGTKARLTFGDLSMVVGRNAKEIEAALVKIANAKFGGAMERQSKTLAGTWSTLQDNAANLAMEMGEGGLLDALKDVVKELTSAAEGGESTARAWGSALGDGIRLAASSARFLATHMSEVKAVLAGLVAYKVGTWAATVVTGFRAATAAAGGFRAAMVAAAASNPFGWIAIGVALLVELAQRWDDIRNLPTNIANKGKELGGKVLGGISAGVGTINTHLDKYKPNENGITPAQAEATATAIQAHYVQKQTEKAIENYLKKNGGRLQKAKSEGNLLATLAGDFTAAPATDATAPKGKGGGGKGGPASFDKKKVDHMAESLSDLRIQAMAAAEAFGLFAGNPDDAKGLEIQNRLLAERKKLLDQGVSADKIEAMSGQMLADITTAVDAETALETLKNYTIALHDLNKEAANANEILGLKQAGASARDIEVATQMQGFKGAGYSDAQLATLKAKIEAAVDAKMAADALDAAEANLQESKKKAAADIVKAQEEAAEAQADAEKAALERRKDMQQEWVDFAIDGIESLGDALTNALDGQENAWRDFFIQLAVQAANLGLNQLAGGGFGASPGGVGAAVFHGGGTVGAGGGYRSISPAALWGAPRMHTGGYAGLRPDEVPAILQRGERVLSRKEVAGGMRGRRNRGYGFTLNLFGVQDVRGFDRAVPGLLRRFRGVMNHDGGGDD